jgi:hypothetical protein
MALTRAALITAVTGELAQVLTLAGLTAVDDAANMKSPIDRTFLALGTAYADLPTATVTDGQELKSLAYARYFVLLRALQGIGKKMDVGAGSARASLSQQWDHVKELLGIAAGEAQLYGLNVGEGDILPLVYAGGIDTADYETRAIDRLPPLFSLSDLVREGITLIPGPLSWPASQEDEL